MAVVKRLQVAALGSCAALVKWLQAASVCDDLCQWPLSSGFKWLPVGVGWPWSSGCKCLRGVGRVGVGKWLQVAPLGGWGSVVKWLQVAALGGWVALVKWLQVAAVVCVRCWPGPSGWPRGQVAGAVSKWLQVEWLQVAAPLWVRGGVRRAVSKWLQVEWLQVAAPLWVRGGVSRAGGKWLQVEWLRVSARLSSGCGGLQPSSSGVEWSGCGAVPRLRVACAISGFQVAQVAQVAAHDLRTRLPPQS